MAIDSTLIEAFSVSLATFFATIGPIDVAAMFAALTSGVSDKRRRRTAVRGVLISGAILLAFALLGEMILNVMGISLAALRAAGGVLLLLIGIDLVTVKGSGATTTTSDEDQEAEESDDLVFVIAGKSPPELAWGDRDAYD